MRPIYFLTSLACLAIAAPVLSEPIRYPTEAEIQSLEQQFQLELSDLVESGFYRDLRTAEEIQAREAWAAAWGEQDAAIAPFLGMWVAIEEDLMIFPGPVVGGVCIVDSHLDESVFYTGRVLENKLYTDNGLVLVVPESPEDFIYSAIVPEYDDQAYYYAYSHPSMPIDPRGSDYFQEWHPEVVVQFDKTGCFVEPLNSEADLPEEF